MARGGKRLGAGRKNKGYEQEQLRIYVPKDIKKKCETLVKSKIKEFEQKKLY